MNFWYSSKIKWQATLLSPLSLLVSAISGKRRAGRNKTPYKAPVIVVGNLTVGGTGKTPMIIWLVHKLQQQGFRVGVVSRGYGAAEKPDYPLSVSAQTDVSVCGDEPKLIQNRTGCAIVVDPKRHRAVTHLLESHTVDVVISDDGMQHYAMHRDLEILMVDGHRLFGNELLLPAGPLREAKSRLGSVDFIVTKGQPDKALPGSVAAELSFSQPENYAGVILPHCDVCAVSGIGNFDSFVSSLTSLGFRVAEQVQFNDHQKIDRKVLASAQLPVIITEKDAVKLKLNDFPKTYVLKLDYSLPESFEHKLIDRIEALIHEKSRHHSSPL